VITLKLNHKSDFLQYRVDAKTTENSEKFQLVSKLIMLFFVYRNALFSNVYDKVTHAG